jgi:hypothetical protein
MQIGILTPTLPGTRFQKRFGDCLFLAMSIQELGTPHRFSNLRETMYAPAGGPFPRLRGKGADISWLAEPLRLVWCEYMDDRVQSHRMVLRLLTLSCKLEDIVRDNTGHLPYPGPVCETFMTTASEYAGVLTWLGEHFHTQPGPAGNYFNYTIKVHELLHIAFFARWINPSRGWCYAGEDMQMKSRQILASCTKGFQRKANVTSAALEKYWRGKSCDLATFV